MLISIEITKEDGSFVPLEEIERHIIKIALEKTDNWTKIAQQLGIGRSSLYRKIKEHGLESFAEELRLKRKRATAEEKKRLLHALQETTNPQELCKLLGVDKKSLMYMLQRHSITLDNIRRSRYLESIRAERLRHEAQGTLLVAA